MPGRTPRKPVLCRLNLHHKWAPPVNADGGDYRVCTACGKAAESFAQLKMRRELYEGIAWPVIEALRSACTVPILIAQLDPGGMERHAAR